MANNIMYLKCNGCGGNIIIAKMFGGAWDVRATRKKINDFLRNHFQDGCRPAEDRQGKYQGSKDFQLDYDVATLPATATSNLKDEIGEATQEVK